MEQNTCGILSKANILVWSFSVRRYLCDLSKLTGRCFTFFEYERDLLHKSVPKWCHLPILKHKKEINTLTQRTLKWARDKQIPIYRYLCYQAVILHMVERLYNYNWIQRGDILLRFCDCFKPQGPWPWT